MCIMTLFRLINNKKYIFIILKYKLSIELFYKGKVYYLHNYQVIIIVTI